MRIFQSFLIFILYLQLSTYLKAQVLSYDTYIKVDGQRMTTRRDIKIQINSRDELKLAKVALRYQEDNQMKVLEATISDRFGQPLRKIKKSEMVAKSDVGDISFYEDNYVLTFDMYWNEFPYQINYSYEEVEDQFLFLAHWTPYLYFQTETRQASLRIDLPTTFGYSKRVSGDFSYDSISEAGITRLIWKSAGVQPLKGNKEFLPEIYELIPFVQIVPENFYYYKPGSHSSWKSFGSWTYSLIKGTDELSHSEKIIVDKKLEGLTDTLEMMKVLYHHLQDHTKYVNVSIDEGGLKPYPASYVCYNKFGDCKALTVYMKALLKYIGVESYFSLIYGDEQSRDIEADFPAQQFNHVILSVPYKGDTIWLENTSQLAPFNYLGTFTQGRKSLVVNKDDSQLVNTPSLDSTDVKQETSYFFELKTGSGVIVKIDQIARGSDMETLSYINTVTDSVDQVRYIDRFVNSENSFVISDYKLSRIDRDMKEINLSIDAIWRNGLKKVGKFTMLPVVSVDLPALEKPEDRNHAAVINYPICIKNTVVYKLDGIAGEVLFPKNVSIKNEFGSYQESYFKTENSVTQVKDFFLKSGKYDLESYGGLYGFISSLKAIQKKSFPYIQNE